MKYLFIIGGLKAGGTETYLLRFLQEFNARDTTTLLVTSGQKDSLYDHFKMLNINLKLFRVGYRNPVSLYKFYKFLQEGNFDVVCDFDGNFSGERIYCAYLARISKRIVFYRQTDDLFTWNFLGISINKVMFRLVYRYATHLLSNSQMALDVFYPNIKDTRFKVIYNGMNPNLFLINESKSDIRKEFNISEDTFVIGHTARYQPVKNHVFIIRVVASLIHKYGNILLVLAGRNVEQNTCALVKELGVEDNILYLGDRKDVPRILKMFDLYFFPSLSEGQPNALIEAMFSKIPVIASNLPCIVETVPEKIYNQLIDPDNIDEATLKIEFIYLNGYSRDLLDYVYQYVLTKYNNKERFGEFNNILVG